MVSTLKFWFDDVTVDSRLESAHINVADGLELATYQGAVDAVAPLLVATTESLISKCTLEIPLDLTGVTQTGKPLDGSYNQRGGLITFQTESTNLHQKEGFRIPAISHSIMPGNTFVVTDTNIAALATWLTNAHTINAETVRAFSDWGFTFQEALRGIKSRRK